MKPFRCLFGKHKWERTGEATMIGHVTYARHACARRCGIAPKWVTFEVGRLMVERRKLR